MLCCKLHDAWLQSCGGSNCAKLHLPNILFGVPAFKLTSDHKKCELTNANSDSWQHRGCINLNSDIYHKNCTEIAREKVKVSAMPKTYIYIYIIIYIYTSVLNQKTYIMIHIYIHVQTKKQSKKTIQKNPYNYIYF